MSRDVENMHLYNHFSLSREHEDLKYLLRNKCEQKLELISHALPIVPNRGRCLDSSMQESKFHVINLIADGFER